MLAVKKEKITTKDLTTGSVGKQLFLFAVPLFFTSLIQQLYHTVDIMFVGRILGKEDSAAVGAGSLLITCMLGFFTGMGVGVGVVAAQAYGGGRKDELKRIIHTAAGLTAVGAVIFMLLGWCAAPIFLRWMNTPQEIMVLAVPYMRIYFLSFFSMISYNISAGILRAIGDSRSPMLYQLMGGIANVVGNTLFICFFDMGVKGAAFSTLLSQSVAAFLTISHLFRAPKEYRLTFSQVKIEGELGKKILSIGLPSAIQTMVITFSNLIVQSQINSLGVDSIASFTTYFKVENFIYLPILALGQASSTFTSQNIGAGRIDRVQKGVRCSLLGGVLMTLGISGVILILARPAFSLFTNDPDIVEAGRKLAFTTFPFYFIYVFLEVFSSAIRGAGKAIPPMLITLFNMCVVRVGALKIFMEMFHTAQGVAMIYPLTWFCTACCLTIYYLSGRWKRMV